MPEVLQVAALNAGETRLGDLGTFVARCSLLLPADPQMKKVHCFSCFALFLECDPLLEPDSLLHLVELPVDEPDCVRFVPVGPSLAEHSPPLLDREHWRSPFENSADVEVLLGQGLQTVCSVQVLKHVPALRFVLDMSWFESLKL